MGPFVDQGPVESFDFPVGQGLVGPGLAVSGQDVVEQGGAVAGALVTRRPILVKNAKARSVNRAAVCFRPSPGISEQARAARPG